MLLHLGAFTSSLNKGITFANNGSNNCGAGEEASVNKERLLQSTTMWFDREECCDLERGASISKRKGGTRNGFVLGCSFR